MISLLGWNRLGRDLLFSGPFIYDLIIARFFFFSFHGFLLDVPHNMCHKFHSQSTTITFHRPFNNPRQYIVPLPHLETKQQTDPRVANKPSCRAVVTPLITIFALATLCTMAMPANETSDKTFSPGDEIDYFATTAAKRAVTLVVHGLNVKPLAMKPIVDWLNARGSDVYLVHLAGHSERAEPIDSVKSESWDNNMLRGYQQASETSRATNVPLYFLGYSLGGLLGQDLIQFSDTAVHFDKQVLIAPANAIRSRSYLLKMLFALNEKTLLPSYTPEPYQANIRLPIKIYKIMFRKEKALVKSRYTKLNIPTLVLIDRKDELISYRKLKRYRKRFSLDNWDIIVLDSNMKTYNRQYHHLIIDETSMGTTNWNVATKELMAFLF